MKRVTIILIIYIALTCIYDAILATILMIFWITIANTCSSH